MRAQKKGLKIWDDLGYTKDKKEFDVCVDSIDEFFEKSRRCAKLVYCTSPMRLEQFDVPQRRGFKIVGHDKPEFTTSFRDMKGKCMVVTDKDYMRGVDYRLKEETGGEDDGIDLLVAAQFDNERVLQQEMSRVGRYNEHCTRYLLKHVQPVNMDAVRRLNLMILSGEVRENKGK